MVTQRSHRTARQVLRAARHFLLSALLVAWGISMCLRVPTTMSQDGPLLGSTLLALGLFTAGLGLRGIRRTISRWRHSTPAPLDPGSADDSSSIGELEVVPYADNAMSVIRSAITNAGARAVSRADLLLGLHPAGDFHNCTHADRESSGIEDAISGGDVATLIRSADGFVLFSATSSAVSALDLAELLSQSYAMDSVESGHIHAAMMYMECKTASCVDRSLRHHFEMSFRDVDDVLREYEGRSMPGIVTDLAASDLTRSWMTTAHYHEADRTEAWLSTVGATVVMVTLILFFAAAPRLLEDVNSVSTGRTALRQGDRATAVQAFSHLANRYPTSRVALAGMACIGARDGDLDQWASYSQSLVLSGEAKVGPCLNDGQGEDIHGLRIDSGYIVVSPQADTSAIGADGSGDIPESVLLARASCENGRSKWLQLAKTQAKWAFALIEADEERHVVRTLRSCLDDWPDAQERDVVASWIDE